MILGHHAMEDIEVRTVDFCTSIRLAVRMAVAVQSSSSTTEDVHTPYQVFRPMQVRSMRTAHYCRTLLSNNEAQQVRQILLLQSSFLELTKTKARLVEVNDQQEGTDNGAGFKHHRENMLQDELIC